MTSYYEKKEKHIIVEEIDFNKRMTQTTRTIHGLTNPQNGLVRNSRVSFWSFLIVLDILSNISGSLKSIYLTKIKIKIQVYTI